MKFEGGGAARCLSPCFYFDSTDAASIYKVAVIELEASTEA
jgi:hypothetical protein